MKSTLKRTLLCLSILFALVFTGCTKPMLHVSKDFIASKPCASYKISRIIFEHPDYKRYLIKISEVISSNWHLPDSQEWDSHLTSIYVVRISEKGEIIDLVREKESQNSDFDNYILRTLSNSNPLPPIPRTLGINCIEIDLRFKPSGLN